MSKLGHCPQTQRKLRLLIHICYVYKQSFQTPEMSHESKNNIFQLVISSTKYMYKQNRMKSESCQFRTLPGGIHPDNLLQQLIMIKEGPILLSKRAFRKYQLSLRSLSQHSTCSINYNQSMGGGVANGSGGWWQWWVVAVVLCNKIPYNKIKGDAKPISGGEASRKKKSKPIPSIKKNSKFKKGGIRS